MNNVRAILEDAYQVAESGDNTYSELSGSQQRWIETIVEKAESQKAVLAVLITSVTKKLKHQPKMFAIIKQNFQMATQGEVLIPRT